MFYCLFVFTYRSISLADYLSVVFYVYTTNYSHTVKQKKWPGLPPFPLKKIGVMSIFQSLYTEQRKHEHNSGPITCRLRCNKNYLPHSIP
jgi:hypothetical protein